MHMVYLARCASGCMPVVALVVLSMAACLPRHVGSQQVADCDNKFRSLPNPLPRGGGDTTDAAQGQYIVPSLNFSCNALLSGLSVGVRIPEDRPRDKRMFFQIWRPTQPLVYSLVHQIEVTASIEGRVRDRTLVSQVFPTPVVVSSGDAVGYSVVADDEALRVAQASVMTDVLEGVVYSVRASGTDDDDDDDNNAMALSTIDLNFNGRFVLVTTAAFSPLIEVTLITVTASVSITTGPTLVVVDGDVAIEPGVNPRSTPPVGGPASPLPPLPAVVGAIVGVAVLGFIIVVVMVSVVVVVKRSRSGRSILRTHKEDEVVLPQSSVLTKDIDAEMTEYSYIAVGPSNVPPPAYGRDYEAVVGHKELGHRGLRLPVGMGSTQSHNLPTIYSCPYSEGSLAEEDSSLLYQYVPSSVDREDTPLQTEALPVIEFQSYVNGVQRKDYENEPYLAPSVILNELYDQLAYRKCLEIPRTFIQKKELLGNGEFGEVFKGCWTTPFGMQDVAIKMLKEEASHEARVKFLQEATIMGQFCHPQIVRLYGAITTKEPCMLVLEYLSNGDLKEYLNSCDPDSLTLPSLMLSFSRDIADGMKYLSKKGFVHRDLAARNILLDSDLKCKIADFGLSKDLYCNEYYVANGGKIPFKWAAPEAVLYQKYSTSSDVWSYGMVLFEIWSLGHKPFPSMSKDEVVSTFQTHPGYLQPPPPGCPRRVYQLMVDCWNHDHHRRPKFSIIHETLQLPEEDLLLIPEEMLTHVGCPEEACKLGQELRSSFDMYMDLQTSYQ